MYNFSQPKTFLCFSVQGEWPQKNLRAKKLRKLVLIVSVCNNAIVFLTTISNMHFSYITTTLQHLDFVEFLSSKAVKQLCLASKQCFISVQQHNKHYVFNNHKMWESAWQQLQQQQQNININVFTPRKLRYETLLLHIKNDFSQLWKKLDPSFVAYIFGYVMLLLLVAVGLLCWVCCCCW